MTDNEKDKNGLKPTQKKMISDTWYNFLLETNMLDQLEDKPRGWSWFWGLYRLYNYEGALNQPADFNLKAIRDELPAEHWLKDVDDSELDAILAKNDAMMFPLVQSLVDVFERGMGITSTIYFYDLSFDKISDFSNLIFPLNVIFEKTTFIDDVSFNNSIFLGSAYFIKADFPAEANFRSAVFHGETANFSGAVFNKIADFTNAKFTHYANFKGATFSGRTIFKQADFKIHAPRFYGTKFNNELILNRIKLPEAKRDKKNEIFLKNTKLSEAENAAKNECVEKYQKRVEENESAYGTLVYLMEKQNKSQEKHLFFREEMRWQQLENHLIGKRFTIDLIKQAGDRFVSWRRTKIRWKWLENYSTIIFFWLYGSLSDYGYGIGRAFIAWFGHIFIGMLAIVAMVFFTACWEVKESMLCAIPVSFANANPLAFIGFEEGSLMDCYARLTKLEPFWFAMIRVFQIIVGIPLLFLFLVTLRVRFRIGSATSNNKDQ